MSATTEAPATGPSVELATYTTDTGPRRIVGQRVDGHVQLRDQPATGSGRAFLIEPAVESNAALKAIIAAMCADNSQVLAAAALHSGLHDALSAASDEGKWLDHHASPPASVIVCHQAVASASLA